MSDCSQVSDGAAALVLVSEDGLAKLGKSPSTPSKCSVWPTGNLYEDGDLLSMPTTQAAANKAYAQAGVAADQIDVAEVHDCFTVTELLIYEALGFASKGQGAHLVREGRTDITGDIPVNTGGGLIGFGHCGATGVKQILEIYRQMKGRCGDCRSARSFHRHDGQHGRRYKTAVCTILANR